MSETLSTKSITELANLFYQHLVENTGSTQERLAILTIVNTLIQLEAANAQGTAGS